MGALNILLIFVIWIAFFLYINNSKNRIKEIRLSFSLVFIYFVVVYLLDTDYSNKMVLYDMSLVYIFAALTLHDRLKTFNYFVNFGTILLVFSIIEYLLYFGLGKGVILASFDRGEDENVETLVLQGLFNYYIFDTRFLLLRFQSLFREPNYLGQCAGLVLLNYSRLPLKKTAVWLVAGIMSVSMFFYVFMLFIPPIIYIMRQKNHVVTKLNPKYIIGILIFLMISVCLMPQEVKEIVSDRVEHFLEEGNDKRTTKSFNEDLSMMLDSEDAFWGYGATSFYKNGYAFGNAGIKAELYKYGVIGVGIVVIAFILLAQSFKTKKKLKILVTLIFILYYYNNSDIKYALYTYIPLLHILDQDYIDTSIIVRKNKG